MAAARRLAYVVDDEEVIATTLALILNRSGFEAVAFTEPLKALRAAEGKCPDFLITDVSMPLLNGIELGITHGPAEQERSGRKNGPTGKAGPKTFVFS